MQAAQIIPFRFDAREVRTLLIDDQPWFVATDVAAALKYLTAKDMARNLDDDEKGRQILPTLGGEQEMLVINESGLYSAILRSRKAEAKRFKKWVTAEVLPAIRKHGRYEDQGQMHTLIGQTIGTDGFHCLGAVLDGKLRHLPMQARRRAKQHVWSQVHKAFSVVSAQDIPAAQLDSARNFIAAYALEGDWLGKEERTVGVLMLNEHQAQDLSQLLHYTDWVKFRWDQGISEAVKSINPKFHSHTWEFFAEASQAARRLEKSMPELLGRGGGLRPSECIAKGHPTGHPAN